MGSESSDKIFAPHTQSDRIGSACFYGASSLAVRLFPVYDSSFRASFSHRRRRPLTRLAASPQRPSFTLRTSQVIFVNKVILTEYSFKYFVFLAGAQFLSTSLILFGLSMTRRMRQRHEYLPRSPLLLANIIRDDGDAAGETMLIP